MEIISALWSSLIDDLSNAFPGGLRGFQIDQQTRSCLEPVGSSCRQLAAASLLRSIPKKYQGNIDQVAADSAAWSLFYEANRRCAEWQPDPSVLGPYDEVVIGEIRKAVWEFFNPEGFPLLDFAAIERGVDFGPGTSPGARDCSYLDKIGHSNLTAPNQLTIDLFDQWVAAHPSRVDCEITRTLACGRPQVITAVKMTPVAKTAKISRLVKPEPSLGMFFQKGIQRILEDRLYGYFGIDLKTQPSINSELARIGSETRTYSTLDLKSASDYLSINLCEYLIPRSSLLWLKLFRSPETMAEGNVVPLHMMATMGNAYIFPLQTAIFACVVKGAYSALGINLGNTGWTFGTEADPISEEVISLVPKRILPTWGVFGDDIVVHWEAYETVIRALRYFGFIPNLDKSFTRHDGFFRESCGADYFHGFNVRGVYAVRLETPQDWYSLINNLTDWSARTGLALPKTIEWCLSHVQRCEVPPWENPDSGIRMPLDCVRGKEVFRGTRPTRTGPDYQGSYLYKRYVPRGKSFNVSDEVAAASNGYWNSSAVFQAAIRGMLRGGRVSLRMWETPYRKALGVAPCWDYLSAGDVRSTYKSSWFRMARVYYGS